MQEPSVGMMAVRETLSVAIDALRANKLRAILTSIGVIIGSAAIVLVVTVALTSQKFVIGQIEGIGSNLVWVELINAGSQGQPLNYELTIDDMNAVKATMPGVTEVAGTRELPMSVVVSGRERPVNLIGVTEGYQAIRRLIILRGRYFDASDMEDRSKVCLITKQVAERVFGFDNPLGGTIRMGELSFTVIGVFRERVSTFGLSEIKDESVIIPLTLMKYYTGRRRASRLVRASGPSRERPLRRAAIGAPLAQPPSHGSRVRRANTSRHSQRRKKYLPGAHHRSADICLHFPVDQWNRHHEHHADHGERAHA